MVTKQISYQLHRTCGEGNTVQKDMKSNIYKLESVAQGYSYKNPQNEKLWKWLPPFPEEIQFLFQTYQ